MSAKDIDWDNITKEQRRWLEGLCHAWLKNTTGGGQMLRQHGGNLEVAKRSVFTMIAAGLVEVKRDEKGHYHIEPVDGLEIQIDKVEKIQ